MNDKTLSITILADAYPAPGRMKLVFVQQLVHAMIDQGVKVTVVAWQSLTHALVHKEKLLPKYSKARTDSGAEYEIYRPYILSTGNNELLKGVVQRYNRHAVVSVLKRIKSDVLYCHFWSSAFPVYEYALKKGLPLFVACGEGDDALEHMVETTSKDRLKRLVRAVSGVMAVNTTTR